MDPKTHANEYPYAPYQGTPTWNLLNNALDDLVENHDLIEQTHRDYIVGYLCKVLSEGAKRAETTKQDV
jgi:hypothetical protein